MHSWGRGTGWERSGAQASFAVAFTFDHGKFPTVSNVSGMKPHHRKAEFLLREEIWILVKEQGRQIGKKGVSQKPSREKHNRQREAVGDLKEVEQLHRFLNSKVM